MINIPLGFNFASIDAGFKYQGRDDLAFILSSKPAQASGVFTQNRFQAAPVIVAQQRLRAGREKIQGILINSGQANACTGDQGLEDCLESVRMTAEAMDVDPDFVLPASTGVIGQALSLSSWRSALPGLQANLGHKGPLDIARAILTTDAYPKTSWRKVQLSSGEINILALAKGAGMICPDMATMLCFVLTDAAVHSDLWQEMLEQAVQKSFNRISVDGDTSTNDCVLALANGASKVGLQDKKDRQRLQQTLDDVCCELAYLIVQDAEGGSKVLRIKVNSARDAAQAEQAARCIAHSPLVKCAFYGQDPNWGRIVAALGRSGADFSAQQVAVFIQGRPLFEHGRQTAEDLDALGAQYMHKQDIELQVDLGQGKGHFELWTSDLTLDYVRINSDYRS